MYSEYYNFGGVTLCLRGDFPWSSSDICEPFRTEPCCAGHQIHIVKDRTIPQPPANALHQGQEYRWRENGRFCLLQHFDSRYTAFAVRENDTTELWLSDAYYKVLSSRMILESVGIFDLLADFGMMILHSAYIVTRDGQGILFSGESGAGKSTQASLWQQYAGAEIVNGDRALISPGDKMAHGIFYAGTSGICRNVSAPLRAIVLLRQHTAQNHIYRPRLKDAFVNILNQCSFYPWAPELSARMTALTARLTESVPVYCLDCCKDESAVWTLDAELRRG